MEDKQALALLKKALEKRWISEKQYESSLSFFKENGEPSLQPFLELNCGLSKDKYEDLVRSATSDISSTFLLVSPAENGKVENGGKKSDISSTFLLAAPAENGKVENGDVNPTLFQNPPVIQYPVDTSALTQDASTMTNEKIKMRLAGIKAGFKIGPFTILQLLGQGGMGIVYLAEQKSPDRKIALKLMTKVENVKIQRFLREAEVSAQLDHPNIVKAYMAGTEGDIPYIAMSYIDGVRLDHYVRQKFCSLAEKLEIVRKVADALQYAHQKKVIHRDIKPGNIMVTENGEPILMDFGLARSMQVNDNRITKTGEVFGTPQYMSPEQIRGAKRLDARSDIYSLGVVLYEIITGHTLYTGDSDLQILYNAMSSLPRMPHEILLDIPDAVEAIVVKSIEKNPKRRYQTAEEMSLDIQRYLKNEVVKAKKRHKLVQIRWYISARSIYFFMIPTVLAVIFMIFWFAVSLFLRPTNIPTVQPISSEELTEESISQGLTQNPSVDKYFSYINFLHKSGSISRALQQCDQAIEWLQNTGSDSFQFRKKKANILFDYANYKECGILYRKLWEESFKMLPRDTLLLQHYVESLDILKEYQQIENLLKPQEKNKPREYFTSRLLFYAGLSLLKRMTETVSRYQHLERILKNDLPTQEKEMLTHSTLLFQASQRQMVAECITMNILGNYAVNCRQYEKLNKRLQLYLGYTSLWRNEWNSAEWYLRNASLFKPEHLSEEEVVLISEAFGIFYFCEKDYIKAIRHFSQCIDHCPWESSYYFDRAYAYLEKQNSPENALLNDCLKAMELCPSNLLPFELMTTNALKNQKLDDDFYNFHVLADYYKRLIGKIEPEIWEPEYQSMANSYLQEMLSVPASKTLPSESVKKIVDKMAYTNSQAAFQTAQDILLDSCPTQDVIQYIEILALNLSLDMKSKESQKKIAIERISQTLRKIQEKQKEGKIRKLKVSLAYFIVVKDSSIKQKITHDEILCLNEILCDNRYPILLRYWASEMLMSIRDIETYTILKANCSSADITTRILALASMARSGFRIDPVLLKNISANLNQLGNEALVILFDAVGEHLPIDACIPFLSHSYEKVRVAAAKAVLLLNTDVSNPSFDEAVKTFIASFSSDKEEIRSYAYWWLFNQQTLQSSKIRDARLVNLLETNLVQDTSSKVRYMIATVMGRLTEFEALPKEQWKIDCDKIANRLKQILPQEADNTIRLQIAMAIVSTNDLEFTMKNLFNSQERFLNRIAPLFRIFTESKFAALPSAKVGIFQSVLDMVLKNKLLQDSDQRLHALYIFYIGKLLRLESIPAFLKQKLFLDHFKQALNSQNRSTRMAAAHGMIQSYGVNAIIRKVLKERLQEEKDELVRDAIVATLSYLLLIEDKGEIEYAKQYPKAVAYAYYRNFEETYRGQFDDHLWSVSSALGKEERYWLHLEAIICNIAQGWSKLETIENSKPIIVMSRIREMAQYSSLKPIAEHMLKTLAKNLTIEEIETLQGTPIEKFTPYEVEILKRFHVSRKLYDLVNGLGMAIKYDRQNAKYHFEIFIVLEACDQLDMAMDYLSNALAIDPDRFIYHLAKVRMLIKMGKIQDAYNLVQKLEKQNNGNIRWLLELKGKALLLMKEWEKAKDAFFRQHLEYPKSPEPLIFLGHTALWAGNTEEAASYFQHAYELLEKEQKRINDSRDWLLLDRVYIGKAYGYYHLGMARLCVHRKNTEEAVQHCIKGKDHCMKEMGNYREFLFCKESLSQYPEIKGLLEHPSLKDLPKKTIGFYEIR